MGLTNNTKCKTFRFTKCGICGNEVTYDRHSSIFSNKLAKDDKNEPDIWQAYHYECIEPFTVGVKC